MELYFTARFEKFRDSLLSLKKINTIEWPENEDIFGFIWCGVISKFCITFDLSYKLAKDILVEYHGIINFAKGSPREILKEAYSADVINDEKWISMLKARNEIVHEYKDLDSVNEWCEKIIKEYIPLFEELLEYTKSIIDNQRRPNNL
ncbi:MAG: HI0074 family nucleotidyltransferase substrate-binding subunit [Defluviitaleaceae bacterium]|nr:HI0074 family nucleotidyltransferase substrate-binding subunit [Defluviitaleaceae bacterium]